jgi:hypothetical protein
MEVHAHTHTPRKKWTHYFWEFLMLFLAVFCGFLAENKREHIVESKREKKLMKNLHEDLKIDRDRLINSPGKFANTFEWLDSSIILLDNENLKDKEHLLAEAIFKGTYWPYITFTDVTLVQLRNAGYFRLIQNDSLSNVIASYDTRLKRSTDLQVITRENSRLIDHEGTNLFDYKLIGDVFQKQMAGNSPDSMDINQLRDIKLMSYDAFVLKAYQLKLKKIWIAYKLLEADYKRNFTLIMDLIGKLEKEYHLK